MIFSVQRSTLLDTVTRRTGDHAVLVLSGELDASVAGSLYEALAALTREGVIHVALDLSDLEFLDSVGIGAIISEHKRTEAAGGELILLNPRGNVRRVLEMTGLMELLTIFPKSDPSHASNDETAPS